MLFFFLLFAVLSENVVLSISYDLTIYAATPAGIAAAFGAADANTALRILLLEPTNNIGGMATAGGIGLRDFATDTILNGTVREWAMINAKHYGVSYPVWQPDHWVGNRTFWTMLASKPSITVILNAVLSGVKKNGSRIVSLGTKSNGKITWWSSKYVIDASYEGDIMIAAGCSLTWGREAKNQYNESLGGIPSKSLGKPSFSVEVDATESGPGTPLLKYVWSGRDPRTAVGEADDKLMAFSYRVCLTTNSSNKAPFIKPANYSTKDFELHRRYIAALIAAGKNVPLPFGELSYRRYPPGNKFDACCGSDPLGIDLPELSAGYANGTRALRANIAAEYRYFVQGLLWFWSHDPKSGVPNSTRAKLLKYGLCMDEWPDNGHFPPQLYVREAARLVGDRVYIQQDRVPANHSNCRNDSIALGAWGFDIHAMSRTAVHHNATFVVPYNEGLTPYDTDGRKPFEIPYWVMLPKRKEMQNLLVPVCLSVSHVAFSAIRVEPTLWQLGQAAGIASATAIQISQSMKVDEPIPLHDVNISTVQKEILKQGVFIHYPIRNTCSSLSQLHPNHNIKSYGTFHLKQSRHLHTVHERGVDKIFNITDFGGVGDGKTKNTDAINKAVSAVRKAGHGTIYFPQGEWLTAPFNVTSHCTLYFSSGAILLGSTDIDDWPIIPALPSYGQGRDHVGPRRTSLIHGQNLTDVIITGENATINGQGKIWWDRHLKKKERYTRGHLIELMWSVDVEVSNLVLINSPFWTVHPVYVDGFLAHHLTILNPMDGSAPNTDGIDPDSTQNVLIHSCNIRTGDDNIAIKSGWDIYGYTYNGTGIPSRNIIVHNCTFTSPRAAGVCIGSEMSGGVENVTVYNVHITNSSTGLRLKTGMGRGSYIKKIFFTQSTISTTNIAFQFNEFYGGHPVGYDPTATPTVDDIVVNQVLGNSNKNTAQLKGLLRRPMTTIQFTEVHFMDSGGWDCSDVHGKAINVTPAACSQLQP